MNPKHQDPNLWPERLAAYADGEIDAASRLEVAEGLACHPHAAAEVEGVRYLDRLCRATRPSEPSEARWSAVLGAVENALAAPAPVAARRAGGALTSLRRLTPAAAVLLLLTFGPPAPQDTGFSPSPEPLPVASPEDVDILSVQGRDSHLLVVGEPPLREALIIAAIGDVRVDQVFPDVDGVLPQVLGESENPSGTPMIVAPLGGGTARESSPP